MKLIANRYIQKEKINDGGFGVVYYGIDNELKKSIAIKVLKPEKLYEARERFQREAEIPQKFNGNVNIIKVYDFINGEQPCIIMEYIEGSSLGSFLIERGRLDARLACQIMLGICDGLIEVHRLDIVHRDLSPQNILLTKNYQPVITDFGIAQVPDVNTRGEKPHPRNDYYASPEQKNSKEKLTPKSDMFTLGLVFYDMLVTRLPEESVSENDLLELPPLLREIIRSLLAQDPENRLSAEELWVNLLPIGGIDYAKNLKIQNRKLSIEIDDLRYNILQDLNSLAKKINSTVKHKTSREELIARVKETWEGYL